MTIFDIINTLFFKRKNSCEDFNLENLNSFQPYMINRWLSFYDNHRAVFVNETLNKFSGIFSDKVDSYNFFFNLIPQQKYKRIQYIKKPKRELNNTEPDNLTRLASNANISRREIDQYIDFLKQQNK